MPFQDKDLICRDCGNSFAFTAGEQEFYQKRGLTHEPTRCRRCRESRKSGPASDEPEKDYVNYGASASFGGRSARQMHPVTCSECGEAAEVPFQPRPGRPVYCPACYEKMRDEGTQGQS